MDSVVYIFSDFIPPVDSGIIARHAVKNYIESQTPFCESGFMESINWTYLIPIIVLLLTPFGIYFRERYTRFKDALNVLEFVNFWNITLIARIDQMICNINYNRPLMKALLNDTVVPEIRVKGVLVELDITRVSDLEIEKLMDLFINYRDYDVDKKQEMIHFANNQIANYLIIKGAIDHYKSLDRLEVVITELDDLVLEFRHSVLTFIESNGGRLYGGGKIITLFVDYQKAIAVKNNNARKLDFDFIKEIVKILVEQYTNMRGLNGISEFIKQSNKLHFKYTQFFKLATNSFEGEIELLIYLQKARVDICKTQMKLLENPIKGIWQMGAGRFNDNRLKVIEMFQNSMDEGISKKQAEMEQVENDEEKLKQELLGNNP